jgi:ABC-type sugar transport system ATPase subunit
VDQHSLAAEAEAEAAEDGEHLLEQLQVAQRQQVEITKFTNLQVQEHLPFHL